jgi:hypothetical protein
VDHDLRLQDHRARWLDLLHGRWLQRDPAGYVDGMNLYEYVCSTPTVASDPMGLLKQAAIELPQLDGTANIVVRTDPLDSCLSLVVDGESKWLQPTLRGHESLPFDYKWLKTEGRGWVELRTLWEVYRREYEVKKHELQFHEFKGSYGFVENLGVHVKNVRAEGHYDQYATEGSSKLWWASDAAVWTSDIVILGQWYYSQMAGEGAGKLYGDCSPFGMSAAVSTNRGYYRRIPVMRKQSSTKWRLPADEERWGTNAELTHPVNGLWFVIGEPATLSVEAMLAIGGSSGIPRTFEIELPGGPRQFQEK